MTDYNNIKIDMQYKMLYRYLKLNIRLRELDMQMH